MFLLVPALLAHPGSPGQRAVKTVVVVVVVVLSRVDSLKMFVVTSCNFIVIY